MINNLPFSSSVINKIQLTDPTPFYIYDGVAMKKNAHYFNNSFRSSGFLDYSNYFAVKALPNPKIMELLEECEMGFDCSSLAELMLCERIGANLRPFPNGLSRIIFTSNETHYREYQKAKDLGAIINFDDISHIEYFQKHVGELPELVCFRYNPGTTRKFGDDNNFIIGKPEDAKFGLTKEQLMDSYRICKDAGCTKFGLHTMVASNELDSKAFVETAKMLLELVVEVKDTLGVEIGFVNLGGGVGVNYKPDQKPVDLEKVASEIRAVYNEIIVGGGYNHVTLLSENGRAITGPFGYLVTTAIHSKNIYKKYVGVDATMANLMRPGMYGSYHHITNLTATEEKSPRELEVVDVVGSLCENNDKFAIDRELPVYHEGDILVIQDAGAHSHSMGFNYNGKLRSAEFLLGEDESITKIRRAETYDDLFGTLRN